MDTLGNQLASGVGVRINGQAPLEWGGEGRLADQLGGRDLIRLLETFGEAYIYYTAFDPTSGRGAPKTSFVKRIVSGGVPLLVGAGRSSN